MILANVRTPEERNGDLKAQIGANQRGVNRLVELIHRYGLARSLPLHAGITHLHRADDPQVTF